MTAPTATFVQLYSQDPTDAGSATGALYSRVTVASGAGSWTRGTGGAGTITNASAITITGELHPILRVLRTKGESGTSGGAVKCVDIRRNTGGEGDSAGP